jgi:hypothetical protein
MGLLKEEYMQQMYDEQQGCVDYELMEYEYENAQPNESTNQLNNKMTKKTMQEKLTKREPETKSDTLNRLFKENNLSKEDVHKDPRGFAIIKREGIDKIVSMQNIKVAYEVVVMDRDWVVLKAVATMGDGANARHMMSFGEANASDKNANLVGGGKKFPVAMAEKRAMSRVVLKIAGFYEHGVFGQDEMDNE